MQRILLITCYTMTDHHRYIIIHSQPHFANKVCSHNPSVIIIIIEGWIGKQANQVSYLSYTLSGKKYAPILGNDIYNITMIMINIQDCAHQNLMIVFLYYLFSYYFLYSSWSKTINAGWLFVPFWIQLL